MTVDLFEVELAIHHLVKRNRFYHRTRRAFHDALQRDLFELGASFGLVAEKEYPVKEPPGRIDVVWRHKNGKLVMAFEIDSSLRNKSIAKLANLPFDVERVWVCYSKKLVDVRRYERLINGRVLKYEIVFERRKRG